MTLCKSSLAGQANGPSVSTQRYPFLARSSYLSANAVTVSPATVAAKAIFARIFINFIQRDTPGRASPTVQVFVEKIESTLPRQLGCSLVVTWRRVVMETMIDALINVCGVGHVIGLERFLVGRPSTGDTGIQRCVVKQKRRLDLGSVLGRRLPAKAGRRPASLLATVPPKQKPTTPILPVQSGRDFNQATEAKKSSNILFSS